MVAIADVAHYVPRESALDREALKRGTSVYFHDYCIPMLPPKLSEELCSLKPKVDRLVVVVEMTLDRSGVLSSYQFFRGVIHSKQRFTYDEVNQYLSGEKDPPASSAVALKDLSALRARLLEQRLARKALHFERKELHMTLTKKRTIQSIGYRTSGESQSIVEECMILANQCAAQFLSDHYPKGAVYRTHEVPSEDSLTTLNKKLVLFSINASIPAKKKQTLDYYQIILGKIKKHPLQEFLYPMVLQSLPHALYTSKNGGHFGLGLQRYTQFTSPIRRYSDIIAHRLILDVLSQRNRPSYTPRQLEQLCASCSDTERTAESAQRLNTAYFCCHALKPKLGHTTQAVIMSFYKAGAFVSLPQYHTEAYLKYLHGRRTHASSARTTAVATSGSFSIGQTVPVRIVEVNLNMLKVRVALSSKT